MSHNASFLRANIYRLLDHVLETGEPLEIKRKGHTLRIVPSERPKRKLDRLKAHPEVFLCDPEELVHLDWSNEWKP